MIKTAIKDLKFKNNQSILKVYGTEKDKKIKVITFRTLRTSGIEDDSSVCSNRCSVNSEKLSDNVARAKSKIFELAFCNEWQFFFTGTIDPTKYDRTDLDKFHKDFTQWIRNLRKGKTEKIDFLIIPELHEDGKSWHIHGFINGLYQNELYQFCVGDVMGKAIAEKVKNGETVYNWIAYSKKFGFCDLEPIRNAEAVSKYVTKYISKNLAKSVTELNAHLYYHSRGLKTAEIIKKGVMSANITPSYSNEYCSVAWLDFSKEALQDLANSFINIDYYSTRH